FRLTAAELALFSPSLSLFCIPHSSLAEFVGTCQTETLFSGYSRTPSGPLLT
ncbi:uncharacterized protein PgNI_07617, partial [Pyricularia grisea]|uniref:Uncharacterized protein n=1 Tax=Pyricularia grisea TaxID=148305 RepID=A0A6P8B257_PYRGI